MTPLSTQKIIDIKSIKDVIFSVDKDLTFENVTFEVCAFNFQETSILTFKNCDIKSCKFIGTKAQSLYRKRDGTLSIEDCSVFVSNEITNQFLKIQFSNSKVNNFTDKSSSFFYTIDNTHIVDSRIEGVCDSLTLKTIFFNSLDIKKSIWDKKVVQYATCVNVVFDEVKLNPFYLATKCPNKESIDLSRATLVDNWSRLRKTYAGLSLFIVFFLTFLFFLPLITHSFFLLVMSKIEEPILIKNKISLLEALLFGGKDGFQAFGYCILTIVLILYNVGRLYMTITISKLRQEEIFLKDSNFNLVSMHPDKYRFQLRLDKILSIMFKISAVYAILKLIDTLMIKVPDFN